MSKQLERIEKYLVGQMTSQERQVFEDDLLANPALKKAFDQLQVIDDALELEVEDKLRGQLKELASTNKKATSPRVSIGARKVLTIAAGVLVLVVAGIWWSTNTNSADIQTFVSDQYIAYHNTNLRAEESSNQYAPAFNLLTQQDTVGALEWLKAWQLTNPEDVAASFFLADLSYQAGAWQQAEKLFLQIAQTNSILWGEKAAWNYVLISAQHAWSTEAEAILQSIRKNKNHSFYQPALRLEKMMVE